MKTLTKVFLIFILTFILCACKGGLPSNEVDLDNSAWVLTAIDNYTEIIGIPPTLEFEGDMVSGNASCNIYSGSYQLRGETIIFGPLARTEMYCMEPEGVMDQEQIYLEILGAAKRFELVDGLLTIYSDAGKTLTFQTRNLVSVATNPPSTESPNQDLPTITPIPNFEPPAGFKEYRDIVAGISIYIPENWTVTGVINGQYAIFQSYPADKYIGGEAREPGDTKCDLNIRPVGTSAAEIIQQWESNPRTTIVSDEEVTLKSGLIGRWFVIESMGRSVSFVAEINHRAISLTCFGNPEPFEKITQTLSGFEATSLSTIYESSEGFLQYQDTETGVTLDMPGSWMVTGIIPGQRATLQSYPENKYIGGEAFEAGDTKCELSIYDDIRVDDFVIQMISNETITIITQEQITLISGQTGYKFEINSLGRSMLVITEINASTVVLKCYGDFTLFDAIAITLKAR